MPAKPGRVAPIPSLLPRGPGHRFMLYGDSCSGVPGAPHEHTFAAVNRVVQRLEPPPGFIVFPGDEVSGLTADPAEPRAQWRYWLDHEMAWLDRARTPPWHSTGNHTTYDATSEGVFAAMLPHLPRNGPPGQDGLSYWVRHGDLLLVFVHTLWTGLRGPDQVMAVILGPHPGRSPHQWWNQGPAPDGPFDLQLLVHTGMGPGGIMVRTGEGEPWSSLAGASPWGAKAWQFLLQREPTARSGTGHGQR